MTDHPLTETTAVEMWDASPCPEGYEFRGMLTVEQDATLYAMRAAFDAGREHERTNPEDARPWEPLNGDPVRVGDEVRQEQQGLTITGVVARVDDDGDPRAAEGRLIGLLKHGTWYVRRAVQELPTEDGAEIVPNEGHRRITATVGGRDYTTRRATYNARRRYWVADWREVESNGGETVQAMAPDHIAPGTWKADEK